MEFNATFIIAFISFIVFTILMNIILYQPINKIVKERQDFIDGNYDDAKHNSNQADKILREKEETIKKAKFEAKEKFSSENSKLKSQKETILLDAKNKSKNELNNKRNDFINIKNSANQDLKNEVIGLAQLISNKFLEENEEIKEVDYKLIDEIMQG